MKQQSCNIPLIHSNLKKENICDSKKRSLVWNSFRLWKCCQIAIVVMLISEPQTHQQSDIVTKPDIVTNFSLLKCITKAVKGTRKELIMKKHICHGFTHFLPYHFLSCESFNREVPKWLFQKRKSSIGKHAKKHVQRQASVEYLIFMCGMHRITTTPAKAT